MDLLECADVMLTLFVLLILMIIIPLPMLLGPPSATTRKSRLRTALCTLLLLVEFVAFECDLSFRYGAMNLLALALGLVAYGYLFLSSRNIPHALARNIVGFTLFAPLLCALLALPLTFLVGTTLIADIADSGEVIQEINHGYQCRIRDSHAMVTSYYTMNLYRHWEMLPLIERQVAQRWGDYNDPTQVSCGDVIGEYVSGNPEMANKLKELAQ